MPDAYTITEIRQNVALNLGGGRVDIELDHAHFTRALDAALKVLARWYPMHGYQVLAANPGGQRYKLTASNLIGVLDVTAFNGGSRFEEAPYYTRWVDRMLELGDMRDTQRVFGDKPEWHAQEEINQTTGDAEHYVYLHFTRSSFVDTFARIPSHACVQFAWYISPTEDANVGIRRVPYDFRQWVEDFATAKCREILGDIRAKYGGVPGSSDGSVLPSDGISQIERARQDMATLVQDLRERRRQAPLMFD